MSTCVHCNTEFQSERATRQFCSAACRAKSYRTLSTPNAKEPNAKPVTDKSVTEKNTETLEQSEIYTGHCGHTSKNPICICYACFQAGVRHSTLKIDIEECKVTPTKGFFRRASSIPSNKMPSVHPSY